MDEEDSNFKKNKNDYKSENDLQNTLLDIKKKYGKNVILKGMNLESGSTTKERNEQIGGHRGWIIRKIQNIKWIDASLLVMIYI